MIKTAGIILISLIFSASLTIKAVENLLENKTVSPKKWIVWIDSLSKKNGSLANISSIGNVEVSVADVSGKKKASRIQVFKYIRLEKNTKYKFSFNLNASTAGTITICYSMAKKPWSIYASTRIKVIPGENKYECVIIPKTIYGQLMEPRTLRFWLGDMPVSKLSISNFKLEKCAHPSPANGKNVSSRQYLYKNNFNDPDNLPLLFKGTEYVNNEGVENSGCLKADYSSPQNQMINLPLDFRHASGHAIQISAMIKQKNIGIPAKKYLGPKFMIYYSDSSGDQKWLTTKLAKNIDGYIKYTRFIRLPENLNKLSLHLGLQQCTGTIWFDDVSVELIPFNKSTENFIKPTRKLQKTPKFRGVMISPNRLNAVNWKDLNVLKKWNVNLVRYQMSPGPKAIKEKLDGAKYLEWIKKEIKRIDKCIEICEKYGIKVIIDLHRGPGTKQSIVNSNILSWNETSQQTLIDTWRILAKHYKGNPNVYAYEILNEPKEDNYVYKPEEKSLDWLSLAPLAAKEIRKIDQDTPIIISPVEYSMPRGFKFFRPFNIPNIIYTVHMYEPGVFSHQGAGILKNDKTKIKYPGMIKGKYWDKKALKLALKPVRDFQLRYNVPIFVGEFSAIRWAPGNSAEIYIRDCIEIFEEYGWDWTYHAFREWDGWSVEHGNDKNDHELKETTPRKELLLKYFKLNKKIK